MIRSAMIGCLGVLFAFAAGPLAADGPANAVSFRKDVAPIFVEHCTGCHNPQLSEGKYDMSTFERLVRGGKKKSPIVPGDPDESKLSLMMHGDVEPAMPKDADLLNDKLLAKVDQWIKEGAKFDGDDPKMTLERLIGKTAPPRAFKEYRVPTPVTAIAFSPDGQTLAASGYHEITFWNPADGTNKGRWPTLGERVYSIQYSRDGRYLLQAGGSPGRLGEVVLWDVKTQKPVRTLLNVSDLIHSAAISPDGKLIAAAGIDHLLRIWDLTSGKLLEEFDLHADWIMSVAFTPDSKGVITTSRDKTVKLWNIAKKETSLSFAAHTEIVLAAVMSPDGKTGVSVGADRIIRFWAPDGAGTELRNARGHGDAINAVCFAANGKTVYTASADKSVRTWNPANGTMVKNMFGAADWIISLAVTDDEKQIASGSANGDIVIWDIAAAKPKLTFTSVPVLAKERAEAARIAAEAAAKKADEAKKAAALAEAKKQEDAKKAAAAAAAKKQEDVKKAEAKKVADAKKAADSKKLDESKKSTATAPASAAAKPVDAKAAPANPKTPPSPASDPKAASKPAAGK